MQTYAHRHILQDRVEKVAKLRDGRGNPMNIQLTGPAGSGKSTAIELAAKNAGVPYYFIEQVVMPHEVIGSRDPHTGEWKHTGLTLAALHGGYVAFEEFDGWAARPTLAAHPAMANRHIVNQATGEVVKLHPDCVIFALTNTWGQGATMEYVGRNKMDAASLDRLGARIHWTVDERMERKVADNDEVADFVQHCRRNVERAKLKVLISPRATFAIATLVEGGFSILEAAEMNFLAGLSRTDAAIVLEGTEDYLAEGPLPFHYVR